MKYLNRYRMVPAFLTGLGVLLAVPAWALSISDTPLYLTVQVQPNVLFDMSIETPMQGAAYNDHSGSVTGCTGRPTNDPGSTTTISNHTHNDGKTSTGSPPTYSISDYENADGSESENDPGTNLVSVKVNGTVQTDDGPFTGACTTSNDPSSNNHFKTQISGSTLSLCFRSSSTMRDKSVEVIHKKATVTAGSGGSSNAWGTCYFKTQKYIGYFDPAKCYSYSSGQFNPLASPTYTIGASATCGGNWSGNYLNWATMTAIDEFRGAMTGGQRSTDSTTETVLQRTNQTLGKGHSWFPTKVIGSSVSPGNVAPSTVSPFSSSSLYLYNHGYQFDVGDDWNANDNTNYYVRPKVCDSTAGLETNCKSYGTSKKPVGLIQNNSEKMRFAVTSYLADNSQSRDGGVLRARMKETGLQKLDSGTWITNTAAEWDSNGVFVTNPDTTDASDSGVSNSGVVNYINKFGANGYKSYDPIGELYYESLRYFKNLGPTSEYSSGLTTAMKDSFPVITDWDDPIQYSCQKNFIVGINDANPWLDKRLPGTYFTCDKAGATGLPASFTASDCGEPSSADASINVTTLTNTVGSLEGLNATWSNTGTWTSGTATGSNDSVGYVAGLGTNVGSCGASKVVTNLGEVMGTCPYPPKENSYYIAGLAYYANTNDLRGDFDDKQSVSTFMIDTQEYSSNPLDGNKNMLWLTGKYGGFVDKNGNDQPDLPGEWDGDSDGIPDNYVLASQPEKLVGALNRAFTDILDRVSSASAVATNSTRLSTNTRVFQARFNSGDWTGQLRAYPLNSDGSTGTLLWDASDEMPAYGSRTVITRNTTTGAAVTATWANLSTAQQGYLNTNIAGTPDTLGSSRLNWLLGDSSQEERNSGVFRDRDSTILGDIINSDPAYVGVQNFAYEFLGGSEGSAYASFRTANASRATMVYVGANDGMLHAFNAETGEEDFAYIPSAVFPNLSKLTAPNYSHRYYADGSPYVGEAYLSGAWETVLVSGLNAGGKAIYALNVTSPSAFGVSDVMWEITSTDADFTDLGYTYGQPQIGKLQNGDWVAVFGNGYDSANQKAVLYIVDLEDGSLIKKFDTLVGSGASENGMATPALLDTDGDLMVDTIYAGDLRGNVWRFDVSGNSSSTWDFHYKSGSTPLPVFTARNSSGQVQPITAPLEVGVRPSGQTDGYMIYFGTGSYFQTTDSANLQVQSFYGVHDNGTRISTTDRSELVEQTITSEVVFDPDAPTGTPNNDGDETAYRTTSSNSVDYTIKRGWYMDLIVDGGSAEGERVVSAPLLMSGMVVFPTLIPGSDPCSYGGDSWLMQLTAETGASPGSAAFDVNDDDQFDSDDQINDQNVSGKKSKVGIIKTPAVVKTGGANFLVASGTSGEIETTKTLGETTRPRTSWKQIQ